MAAAVKAGFTSIEFDVRLTADRVPVIIHDDVLDRTTTAHGHVAGVLFSEVFGARLRHNEAVTDCRLPTLQSLYRFRDHPTAAGVGDAQCTFVVELKVHDPLLTRLVVVSRLDVEGHVIVQSFNPETVAEALRVDPACDVAILCGNEEELAAAMRTSVRRVNMHYKWCTTEVVSRLHEQGRLAGAWTVNKPEDIGRIIGLGVDTIITDHPPLARRLVAEAFDRD